MPPVTPPPRLHILTARTEPLAVILRRGPAQVFHIVRYNTRDDTVEYGSWLRGRLFPLRCDLSDDGRYMVYLAMGDKGQTWNGVCEPPRLTCLAYWENTEGTWFGGGLWREGHRLAINVGRGKPFNPYGEFSIECPSGDHLPVQFVSEAFPDGMEDEGILYPRLLRDGWVRQGPFGTDTEVHGGRYIVRHDGDSGWLNDRGRGLPALRLYFRGYFSGEGRRYEFEMPDHPEVLAPRDGHAVQWAAWDSLDNLLVARAGRVERWAGDDFARGEPSFVLDLNGLEPPPRQMTQN